MPICWARISRRERRWCSSTSRKAAERAEQTLGRSTYHVVAPHHAADGLHLWRALCRSGRPHPRDLRRDLARASSSRCGPVRRKQFGGGGEEAEVSDVATQCDVILRCALRASKDGYGHIAAPPPFEASAALRHLRVTAVCDLVQVTDQPIRNRGHSGPISEFQKFCLTAGANQHYSDLVPSHRGAARDRHERGAGCGGRCSAVDEWC